MLITMEQEKAKKELEEALKKLESQ